MSKRKYKASNAALRTRNPIRELIEGLDLRSNPRKPVIPLSIGDPTSFGNLAVPPVAEEAVVVVARSQRANGYPPAAGADAAREALARVHSIPAEAGSGEDRSDGWTLRYTKQDVVLASGASHALDLCFSALLDAGDNVLLPGVSFPLYETLCAYLGAEVRRYLLDSANGWRATGLEPGGAADQLVDDRTVCMVVNNPVNPCGAVYDREHLQALIAFAERHGLIIVADEIYRGIVFDTDVKENAATPTATVVNGHDISATLPWDRRYPPLASLSRTVPVLTVDGLAKRYIVPGWRMGWVLVHDPTPDGGMREVRRALEGLCMKILGPNSLIQAALPTILERTPPEWNESLRLTLARNARFTCERLGCIPALHIPSTPRGAMYVLVQIRDAEMSGLEFVRRLMAEESVLVLPGECFGATPGFFRVTFCAPLSVLSEAYSRIASFCQRHLTQPNGI
ncbi:hypothetical protein CDCA_CDCA10G2995 [Cyanidium caldarium]|uniref:Aminotransferase class I/classII large domain-containing protein n=1 Tax=Cyanidium caldarium TaxID=2771 RepID=A0AAV9IY04_CYACA|nr:hypothetical protein CDCA_CDCA10G2995 [Cyanidium caldarium]